MGFTNTERISSRHDLDDDVTIRRLSWGAIAAGAIAAVGTCFVLYAVGLAIESGVEVSPLYDDGWLLLTAVAASFLGSVVTGRSLGPGVSRWSGALNGFLLGGLLVAAGAALVAAMSVDVLARVAAFVALATGLVADAETTLAIGLAGLGIVFVTAMIGGAAGITRDKRTWTTEPVRQRAVTSTPLPVRDARRW